MCITSKIKVSVWQEWVLTGAWCKGVIQLLGGCTQLWAQMGKAKETGLPLAAQSEVEAGPPLTYQDLGGGVEMICYGKEPMSTLRRMTKLWIPVSHLELGRV